MRDHFCDYQKLAKAIEFKIQCINENKQNIVQLKTDMENGIQRFPNSNESILSAEYAEIFKLNKEIMCALYSSGESPSSLYLYYFDAIESLCKTNLNVGYVNVLWMVSLGILLEVEATSLGMLVEIVKKENIHDALIDFFLYTCGAIEKNSVTRYEKEIPYQYTAEIIELASRDKSKASCQLAKYMDTEWFVGHYDYDWKNAHQRHGYVGIWSFDTAALVKTLGLDDGAIIGNIHYPYDLAHFKNNLVFKLGTIEVPKESAVILNNGGIKSFHSLQTIISPQYHALINEVINDYKELADEEFWSKYELKTAWYLAVDYINENRGKNLLGAIIVFILVQNNVILQVDFKDDVQDYIGSLDNPWGTNKVKLVNLVLNNDQNYYMYVPQSSCELTLFEVQIQDTIV